MRPASAVLLSFLAGLTSHAALVTYDFEDLPLGMGPPFTETKGGLVANFSTLDPSGLDVYQNSGDFLLPPFMGRAVSNGTGFPIDITFSAPVTFASLNFGTDNLAGVSTSVTLGAYKGGTGGLLLGTVSTSGSVPLGGEFPQGTASISASDFDTLEISGMQPGLAIDNLTVSTVAEVPEPPLVLLVFSLMPILISSGHRLENIRETSPSARTFQKPGGLPGRRVGRDETSATDGPKADALVRDSGAASRATGDGEKTVSLPVVASTPCS